MSKSSPSNEDTIRLQFVKALDAWVKVEHQLDQIFYVLLKPISYPKSGLVFHSMNGFQAQRDAVEALVEDAVTDEALLQAFSRLVERMRRLATKRNRLVHGRWRNFRPTGSETSVLVRRYLNMGKLAPGEKVTSQKGKVIFFLDDLTRAENEFLQLAADLEQIRIPIADTLGVTPYIEIPASDIRELRVGTSPPTGRPPKAP